MLAEEMARADGILSGRAGIMARPLGRCRMVVDLSLKISRLERARTEPQMQTAVVETALAQLNRDF